MSVLIEKINNIARLNHLKLGATEEQIKYAEKELNLKFSEAYKEYLLKYGVISFYGTEWTGLNTESYLNVVKATKKERELNLNFPKDCFVLENLAIEGILIVSDCNDDVYEYQGDKKKLICHSLIEYLDLCLDREL